jgi:uncharacterized caspase-like protein
MAMASVTGWVAAPNCASAQKRVALVIGNSAYLHAGALTNPKNDATDMAAALKKHGFQVIEGIDLDKAAFDRKVRDFANALDGATVGLFFYAGHGLAVEGQNYLVPVDAQLSTAVALEFEMVRVDTVHRVMERQAKTNVLFLDACRDNPLSRNLARSMGTRSTEIGKGLAPIESGVGTLISFSTQPGNVALDGSGRNSPFAGALIKQLSTSQDDLSAILIAVRNDVMQATNQKQVPWEHSALTGRFYFGDTKPTFQVPSTPEQRAQVSDLFSIIDLQAVKSIADKKQVPLPAFKIYKPSQDLPESMRRFIGVWLTDKGSDTGRQYGLIVEEVSDGGSAIGYRLVGPPNSRSVQTPAAFYPFVGQISEDKLVVRGKRTDTIHAFTSRNLITMTETWKNGLETQVSLRPLWQLVEVERSQKR